MHTYDFTKGFYYNTESTKANTIVYFPKTKTTESKTTPLKIMSKIKIKM